MGLDPYQPAYAGFSNYVTFGLTAPSPGFSLSGLDEIYYNTRPTQYFTLFSLVDPTTGVLDFPKLFVIKSTAKCTIKQRVMSGQPVQVNLASTTITDGNGFYDNWSAIKVDRVRNYSAASSVQQSKREQPLVFVDNTSRTGCRITGTNGTPFFTEATSQDKGFCLDANVYYPITVNSLADSVLTILNVDESYAVTSGVFQSQCTSELSDFFFTSRTTFSFISLNPYQAPIVGP